MILVTAAIILNENNILLVKRAREPYKGYWSFIGGVGAFDHTSDPIEAVKLEVMADINCKFQPRFFMYNYQVFDVPTVTLFFYGPISGEPKIEQKYVEEYKWFDLEEANKMELGFDHNKVLNCYFKNILNLSNIF